MNRELTKREKTLLLILVVLVLVLGYCKLFLEPIDRQITSFRTNTDIEQAELDTDRVRLAQLEQMQQAIAAIKALRDSGRRIPEDCSMIAIDGIDISTYTVPTLTTLIQPQEAMGGEAVRILLDMVEQRAGNRHVRIDTTLRPGGSIAALN